MDTTEYPEQSVEQKFYRMMDTLLDVLEKLKLISNDTNMRLTYNHFDDLEQAHRKSL